MTDELRNEDVTCLSIHRLVREVARGRADGDAALRRAVRALGGAWPEDIQTDMDSWPLGVALAPHVSTAWSVGDWPETDFCAATRAINQSATLHMARNYDLYRAAEFAELNVRIEEERRGPDHTTVAIRLSNLAVYLRQLGGADNLARAKEAADRALRIDETARGRRDPEVAVRLSNLAAIFVDLGGAENLARAQDALERAIDIGEKLLGRDHPKVSVSRSNLATVLRKLGGVKNLASAREMLEQALVNDEAALGPEHPYVGIRCVNPARVRQAQGDIKEALALARRAHLIFAESLGTEHGESVTAAKLLAKLEGG